MLKIDKENSLHIVYDLDKKDHDVLMVGRNDRNNVGIIQVFMGQDADNVYQLITGEIKIQEFADKYKR